jgi:ferredoxin--NADP+ reductase
MTDTDTTPVRIAVVGAGPAGFYAAAHLLKESAVEVDMFERLPTPHGLVRSGVAPDHPKIKSVTRVYEKTAAHPRFRFFGHVELGRDVSREELLEHYHALVYATGAPADRALGIPGEDLAGSWPATDFVGWYNGHPDHRALEFDLSCKRAVVVGNGNVALDVARMLTLSHADLARTDTADHALEVLEHSRIEEVVVVGRRGPAQAAFTNPELLELGEMEDTDVVVDLAEMERALGVGTADGAAGTGDTGGGMDAVDTSGAAVTGGTGENGVSRGPSLSAATERNVKVLRDYSLRSPAGRRRRIVLRFLLSPVALVGDAAGHVSAVEAVRNELVLTPEGTLRAQATAERETIPAGLVLRAIGYRGRPLPGVPFDERAGVVPNAAGRVLDGEEPRRGEYVVGWIKRGPTGVIGTNKKDAQETVDAILADLAASRLHNPPAPDTEAVEALLRARQPSLVTYSGWTAIDRHERQRGEPAGRPRVKLTRIEELLRAASEQSPDS